jgi:hypothetical protein
MNPMPQKYIGKEDLFMGLMFIVYGILLGYQRILNPKGAQTSKRRMNQQK